MTYAGIQMFMDKLKQLINCNDNPLISYPEIIRKRPQFQLLYEELGSMIQTLFIHQHQGLHELEKLNDLKKRLLYTAEEAQYRVDMFVSHVHIRNNEDFIDVKPSLNLDDVRRSLESVNVEFVSMRTDNMMMDSSQRPEKALNQSAPAQISMSRSSVGSKKLLDEIVVGLGRDAELIRDKLVEDQKKVDVVSIVGMGGIGKTTLATKVFNDGFVKHHFHVRIWVTISQTYDKRAVLTKILASIGVKLDFEKASDSKLREMVHKHLMGRRYLIVIDDIWHKQTWDNLKLFFPHDNNGSRILITSRLIEVARHANSEGLIHRLGYLNKEKSWELLCQKVFHGNEYPVWSLKPGMQIVENCQGLPLAVVVIAGVLAKEAWNKKFWVEIAYRTGSYIVGEENGCLETLALSYNHLPLHLRECFLYLGGFPEDHKFKVRRLIWLWVAEGFIQEDGNRSLENIAESYLIDLIDRNLVIVVDKSKSRGDAKACKVHDLVRELCLRKAKEEQFILQTEKLMFPSQCSNVTTPPYKPVRMFINKDIYILDFAHSSPKNLRSILRFSYFRFLSDDIRKSLDSFVLLRVLDLQYCRLNDFPSDMKLLVHLRYLAIWNSSADFPSSICNLWNLQTLVYFKSYNRIVLPSNISNLVNLRHLWSYSFPYGTKMPFFLPSVEKPMNLLSISNVDLGDAEDNYQKCFPYIKELTCTTYLDKQTDFHSLTCLEKLKLTCVRRRTESTPHDSPKGEPKDHITFPTTLKSLTLVWSRLQWSDMSIIQSLPNLEVLKLKDHAFEGSRWKTDDEQEFRKLKYLRLDCLNIEQWEVCSPSFRCLKQLEITSCRHLKEVPLDIGDIPTLELIKIKGCRQSVDESVRRIQEEQQDMGNYDLKIHISTNIGISQFWER